MRDPAMRNRHPYENRYCNGCQCTTRHEVKETSYACLRCGVMKHPTRIVKPVVTAIQIPA
jgi:uncharacterized paraquat-inducible protein A